MASINELEQQLPTLDEWCEENAGGLDCSASDVGAATISFRSVCDPSSEPVIIDCSKQLNGSSIEFIQSFTETFSQCSTEAKNYIKSGRGIRGEISIAEGEMTQEMYELFFESEWIQDPTISGDDSEILVLDDDSGVCSTPFEIVICPPNSGYELVIPNGQLMSESITLEFNLETQRELTIQFHARPADWFGGLRAFMRRV